MKVGLAIRVWIKSYWMRKDHEKTMAYYIIRDIYLFPFKSVYYFINRVNIRDIPAPCISFLYSIRGQGTSDGSLKRIKNYETRLS